MAKGWDSVRLFGEARQEGVAVTVTLLLSQYRKMCEALDDAYDLAVAKAERPESPWKGQESWDALPIVVRVAICGAFNAMRRRETGNSTENDQKKWQEAKDALVSLMPYPDHLVAPKPEGDLHV